MGNFSFYNFTFYEKTGCGGNAKQKALLKSHNISFNQKTMIDNPWTVET